MPLEETEVTSELNVNLNCLRALHRKKYYIACTTEYEDLSCIGEDSTSENANVLFNGEDFIAECTEITSSIWITAGGICNISVYCRSKFITWC